MFGLRNRRKIKNSPVKTLSRRWKPLMEILEDRVVPAFYLSTTQYLTNPTGLLTGPTNGTPLNIALGYMRSHAHDLGLTAQDVANPIVTSQYTDTDTGFTHIYMSEQANGLEVANADLSVTIAANGSIISFGHSFIHDVASLAGTGPINAINATQAVMLAASGLGLNSGTITVVSGPSGSTQTTILSASSVSLDNITAKLHYVPTDQNSVSLAWDLIIRTPNGNNWFDMSVAANGIGEVNTGDLVYLNDWIDHSSYNVIALPNESPQDGGFSIQNNPENGTASPFGWHDTNGVAGPEFTDTRGNNVDAHLDRNDNNVPDADEGGGARPDGGASLNFSGFTFDPTTAPTTTQNQNIAQVNLFYMNNIAHDIHYQYGFTEAAGNFQVNDYGRGGVGGDAVQADAQDGGGINNANFGTPPDGTAPRMQMYLFNKTNPQRDGDLDNSVIIHEYGHGVSNRLTGGPANSNALDATQSGGMGEGWSDFYAQMFLQRSTDTQNGGYGIGTYVLGQPNNGKGIRRFQYSWNTITDPLTFDAYGTSGTSYNGINRSNEVHNSGELWNTALWDMNWLLINKYGYDSNLYTGWTAAAGPGHAGNKLALRLVMDAMKLQPANPSFIDSRNAIIAADNALNGGADVNLIWTAFSRRGLGVNASTASANSNSLTVDYSAPGFVLSNGVLTISGDQNAANQNDTIRLIRDPNNSGDLLVFVNNPAANPNSPDYRVDLALVTQINVNGLGGNDSLNIDESNGVVNVPITYNGGSPAFPTTGGDSLLVNGNSFTNLVYNATGIGAGNINLDGNLITFTSLEPVTVTSALGNVTINLTDAAAHTITLGDDGTPGNNLSKVTIDAGIESMTFTNPTNTLAFAGNNNNNIVILNALDTASLTPNINLVGGTANDEFRITSLRNGQSVNVLANSGTDHTVIGGSSLATFNTGSAAANLANILGTVNVLSNSASTVHIDDSGFAGGRTITSDDIPSMPFFFSQGVHTTVNGLTTAINVNNGAREVQTAGGTGNDTFRINTTLVSNYSAGTTESFYGNDGNDNFFVRPSTAAGIYVYGGSPSVGDPGVPPNGDRLVVYAYGATVNPLFSPDGFVSAPGFSPVFFNNIEFVSVPDRFEINDTPSQATFLGSDPFVTLRDLSIHSVDDPSTPNVNEADIDYFRYVAHDTGYLTINVQYLSIAGGQMVVEVYRPTSLANLSGPNVPGAPFNNSANYITSVPGAVGSIDGTTLNIPVVKGQIYYIKVRGNNQQQDAGNYNLEIENFAAAVPTVVNLPANLPGSAIGTNDNDTGRSNTDGITNNSTPYFIIQADLRDLANAGVTMLTAAQANAGQTAGASVQVYVRTFAGVPITSFFADPVAGSNNTLWSVRTTTLPDGNYQITASTVIFDNNSLNGLAAEVKRSGVTQFGSPPLNFTIDTVAPSSPSFVLNPLDDTGIPGQPNTYVDRITKNPGANFTGTAEAAAWMQFYAQDRNAIPQFGGTAFANAFGQYFIDPTFSLNDPTFFDQDGERLLFSTATDVAGNVSAPQTLLIFLDTRGPQVAGVTYRYDLNGNPVVIDLLNQTIDGQKVSLPQINYIDVTLFDQPDRTDNFIYPAANELLATTPGNYAIIGKRTGNQTIDHVEVLEDDTLSGGPGLTTYRLFLVKPLPDDKFTFKVFDRIQDQAGNALDGDFQPPTLPSGDGVPGDTFVVQFITVDSRAELGFYANGSANIDLNGDFIVNPGANVGDDAIIPYAPNGAAVFSGQFYDPVVGTVDGFDRLGTYGKQGTRYVFRLDFNNDGDFNDPGETTIQTSLQINGLPIAGNWGPSAVNLVNGLLTGSNVGVFDGTTWYLDANGNNIIETAAAGDRVLKGNMKGLPFTGDFDGDGATDLGTYLNGVFYLDLSVNDLGGLVTGFTNYTFRATLPLQTSGTASKLARPVAADFDGDGITDIGLFIPNQTTVPAGQANWFLMNSNGTPWDIAVPSGTVRGFKNAATGFGNDIAATYGSAKALPVVGNFDPNANLKPAAAAAVKAAARTAAANLAHNLADMYFESTDSTDFVWRGLRKGKGR
ncbi:MAG TPA: M36 family metallopeptidase [Gemmatales bacterium]|nr:M36 family metallopeptidase [Gemmatales bacterium]